MLQVFKAGTHFSLKEWPIGAFGWKVLIDLTFVEHPMERTSFPAWKKLFWPWGNKQRKHTSKPTAAHAGLQSNCYSMKQGMPQLCKHLPHLLCIYNDLCLGDMMHQSAMPLRCSKLKISQLAKWITCLSLNYVTKILFLLFLVPTTALKPVASLFQL